MSVLPGSTILQSDMNVLAVAANNKTSLQNLVPDGGSYPYSFPDWNPVGVGTNPAWLTELDNLRNDIDTVISGLGFSGTGPPIAPWIYNSISGGPATPYKVAGWPLTTISTGGTFVNNQYLKFWYEDNGTSQSVTATGSGPIGSQGTFSTQTFTAYTLSGGELFGPSTSVCMVTQEFTIIVGGEEDVTISADFFIPFQQTQGWNFVSGTGWVLDTGTPPVPTFDASGWIPIASTDVVSQTAWNTSGWFNECAVRSRVNGTVSPGMYTITVTVPVPNDTSTLINSRVTIETGDNDFLNWVQYNTFNPPTSYGAGTNGTISSVTLGPGVQGPGIDRIANVLVIDCEAYYPPGGYPFGLTSVIAYETDVTSPGADTYKWQSAPFPQPTFSGAKYAELTVNITATCNGFWTGMSAPIGNINAIEPADMPWNVKIPETGTGNDINPMLTGGLIQLANSYNLGETVESQSEPPPWKSSTLFTQFFAIIDTNGNLQECSTSGTSGAAIPNWATKAGGTTTDGTVKWKCTHVLDDAKHSIAPAVHLPQNIPQWPYYWADETDYWQIPPSNQTHTDPSEWGYYKQWYYIESGTPPVPIGWYVTNVDKSPSSIILNGNCAAGRGSGLGYWIYSISLNRISQTINGIPMVDNDPSGQISVNIGCIRNGSFVSFGTFATGQTYQVLWPVFTSDPLVYQSTERIDLQAVAIAEVTQGLGNVGGLAGSGYPIAAAYVGDVFTILDTNLIT